MHIQVDKDGRARCPWCPTHKRVKVRTDGTFYRHQPYGKATTGNLVPPCEGSGRHWKDHPAVTVVTA